MERREVACLEEGGIGNQEQGETVQDNKSLSPSQYIGPKNESNCLKILSINAQSMNNKFQDLRDLANSTKATVMAIQETWGKNPTTDYSIRGFHRPEFKLRTGEGMNLGGGVGLWIRDDQDYDNIKMISIDRVCEMQAVSLHDLKISIINVYRPFGDMCVFISTLESNILAAKEKYPSNDILMVGDFNINLLKSSCNTDSLIDTTLGLGLIQQVSLPTRVSDNFETLIDHVYTSSRRKLKTDYITDIRSLCNIDKFP